MRLCKLRFHLRLYQRAVIICGDGLLLILTTRRKLGVEPCDFRFSFCALLVVFSLRGRHFGTVPGFEDTLPFRFFASSCGFLFLRKLFVGFGLANRTAFCRFFAVFLFHSRRFFFKAAYFGLGTRPVLRVFGVSPRKFRLHLRFHNCVRIVVAGYRNKLRPVFRTGVRTGFCDFRFGASALDLSLRLRAYPFGFRLGLGAGFCYFRVGFCTN